MEEKETRPIAEAMSATKEALRAMLREACPNERIPTEIEDAVVDELCGTVRKVATAYSVCRAYAWSGLAMAYVIRTRIDCSGITTEELKHCNE